MLLIVLTSNIAPADHTTASASLTANKTFGSHPLNVNFQINVGPPSGSGCAADSYTLSFGDGSFTQGTSSGPNSASHIYTTPGTYNAELTYNMEAQHGGAVSICSPGSARATVVIEVQTAQDLIPDFTFTQPPGQPPVEVQFNAISSSTDSSCAPISNYSWDFGDSSLGSFGVTTSHTFEEEGTYDVTLSVRDFCGREARTMREVLIGNAIGTSTGDSEGEEDGMGDQDSDEAIMLSEQQLQINGGVERIGERLSELRFILISTESIARNYTESGEELTDLDVEILDERLTRASQLLDLTLTEIEEIEALDETLGTVFLSDLQMLREFLFDGETGIRIRIDRARDGNDVRDPERVQFELEDAIFIFQVGPLEYESWVDLIYFNDLYRCQDQMATVSLGLFETFNPNEPSSLMGTNGPDIILGTHDNNVITALGGDDVICGLGGHDTIDGGVGNDMIYGDDGEDTIMGGSGDDEIFGGADDDTLYGDAGADTIYGASGSDEIYGGFGMDEIVGGTGKDTMYGEGDGDIIYGGFGIDEIDGGAGDDELIGDSGTDFIYGGDGNDKIYGLEGDDFLYGEGGLDEIFGGEESDVMDGGDGDDLMYGGDGGDTMLGGPGDDELWGYSGGDTLLGNSGDDLLVGEGLPGESNIIANDDDLCNGGPDSDEASNCFTYSGVETINN